MTTQKTTLITNLERTLKTVSQEQVNWTLSDGHLLHIKKQLFQIIEHYGIDAETLFFKLWEQTDERLRILACYLLPKFFTEADEEHFKLLANMVSGLKDFRLTEVFSQNFSVAIQSRYIDWLLYLGRLASQKEIWSRCFLIQTLGYLADYKVIGIPYYLIILKKMMTVPEETIQNCLSWALLHLYTRWPESVRAFIESFKSTKNIHTIAIICKLSMGTGLWIVPMLEQWLLIEDPQIHENVKSTLLLLSKNVNQ